MSHESSDDSKGLPLDASDGPTLRVRMRRQTGDIPQVQIAAPGLWQPPRSQPSLGAADPGPAGALSAADGGDDTTDRNV